MTDEPTEEPTADRPNPRPSPRPAPPAGADAPGADAPAADLRAAAPDPAPRAAGSRPSLRRRQVGPRRATPRPTPGAGRGDDDATQAVEVLVPERVLVGAAGLAQPTESHSVFALDDGPPEPFDLEGEWVRVPRRSGWLRRTLIIGVVFALVVGVAGVWTLDWVHAQIHPAGPHGAPVQFTIEQGAATNTVANNLTAQKVISNATVFRYWLRRQGGEQTFKAGDYDLFEHMDYPELLTALRAGPKPPVQIRVTIPPGLTIAQTQKLLLEKLPGFDAKELVEALKRRELDPTYAQPVFGVREGLFFPDTYNVDEDASTSEYALLKRMRDQMDKVLKELDTANRAQALGYSTYDILKVASLIEEEAKVDGDRPKIARVIYNRLAKNMALGIDASTRFAVNKTNGEPLTVSDLASDSPWNTRKATGLPPTPISAPSRKSIEAALNPSPNQSWLYYVLTDDGGVKGAHTFATTSAEFEAARKICQQLKYCD